VLDPIRQRRAEILARPGELRERLLDSSARARAMASETMQRVREAMKVKY
jgi:tryptophanyl-tRNA synthetase